MRFLTVATREFVVPRSMPAASRRSCGSGDASGSAICRSAIVNAFPGPASLRPSNVELRLHLVDVGRELREEAKLAHVVARRVACAFSVEARRKALLEALRVGANFVGDRPEPRCIERGKRLAGCLPALDLAFEEIVRQRGVSFGKRFDAVQRETILRARNRVAERLLGIVEASGRLQPKAL